MAGARRLALVAVFVAVGSAPVTGAGAVAERQGTLRVTSLEPVVLKGSRFAAREWVDIRVTSGSDDARRRVRASVSGTFSARFTAISVDRCNGDFLAVARGGRGTNASTKVLPLPLCPPAGGPPG